MTTKTSRSAGGLLAGSHRRSPLLDRPDCPRRPLLSSNASRRGDVSSTARSSTSFLTAPVQQPFLGGGSIGSSTVAGLVDVASPSSTQLTPSRALDGGNIGERRKGLLNTPPKAKSEAIEKKSEMCVSCRSKLRLNERGEYCCGSCGKIQSRSAVSINSLIGPPLLRNQKAGSADVDDKMAQRRHGDNNNGRKLPALLDLPSNMFRIGATQSSPVPLISFQNNVTLLPSANSAPTSLFALMASSHRVLYPPTISEEKSPQPQPLFAASLSCPNGGHSKKSTKSSDRSVNNRHNPYPRADYVRGADLKLTNSSSKKESGSSRSKRARSKTTNGGPTTESSHEKDLNWLYRQRAQIDRQIARVKEETRTSDEDPEVSGLESVTYVSGYYCHVCRKLLRGDYDVKLAHCRDQAHRSNIANGHKGDAGGQDADSLFKYYEETYECIDFVGDDDNGAVADQPSDNHSSVTASQECRAAGTESGRDVTGEDADVFMDTEASSAANVTAASDDEDDVDAEEPRPRERFDRTKISRLN